MQNARELTGLTANEVARRCKVSRQAVRAMERGINGATLTLFLAYAKAIGVRPGALVDQIVGAG